MRQQMLHHDYYYGIEAIQYIFYRLPKALFECKHYNTLSYGAKILYGLMLDRMGLSMKNGWFDEQNRVYIYFTLEDIQQYLNCKHDKGVKLLAELDSDKGAGLIKRVKQGQGKPTKIYVKKFFETDTAAQIVLSDNYYYGNEASQYTFYRLPKVLFDDERYNILTDGAKILYGLMLDRMGLSLKNGWQDKDNRTYIYFTLEDVMEQMGCKRDKGMNMLTELGDTGLIKRVKQGQGKPAKIYIMKFYNTEIKTPDEPQSGMPDLPKSALSDLPQSGMPDLPKSALPDLSQSGMSGLPKSALRNSRSQEVDKTECNDIDFSKINFNDTEFQSYQSIKTPQDAPGAPKRDGWMDRVAKINAYRDLIKDNIEYDIQCEQYGKEDVDEIVEILLETVCTQRETVRVGQEEWPAEVVKSRLLKLNQFHIDYVFEKLQETTTKIYNIRSYLLTTLYNAPSTMSNHYRARVNHDMYGGE